MEICDTGATHIFVPKNREDGVSTFIFHEWRKKNIKKMYKLVASNWLRKNINMEQLGQVALSANSLGKPNAEFIVFFHE